MSEKLDVSIDRQAVEQELGGNEELIRLLLDSTGEGIYGVDRDGNCTFANPACLKLLGFEQDVDLLGKNMHELVHHTRANGAPYPVEECRIYRALQVRDGSHVEDEVMWCADGSSFPAEYWSYPVERDSELVGCVVTFVDITERREAEEELRRSEELTRMLLNSTGEGIYGVDRDGNCTFANPACVRLLGFERDEDVLGRNMHELVHHTRPNGTPYPVEECRIYRALQVREGSHVDDEVMWCADGASFPAEYWSYPVEREDELVGCVVTFVDITKRQEIEEELRQSEKMTALGKLAAGLAHELNNPAAAAGRASSQLMEALDELKAAPMALTRAGVDHTLWESLREWDEELQRRSAEPLELSALDRSDREEELLGWLEGHNVANGWDLASTLVGSRMRSEDLDAIASTVPPTLLSEAINWLCRASTARDLAGSVVLSSQRISTLVDAVKSYSYMDQDPVQTIDVHQGIEDTITLLQGKLDRGIEIVREYDGDIPRVQVPASELNQVWMNLLDNAIDATGGHGRITIHTYQEGDHLVVEVADDGPGIPTEIQSQVFDPFFTTKEVGQGTGLGLDIVRRIITVRCSGQIGFRSQPGKTIFWIHLPVADA